MIRRSPIIMTKIELISDRILSDLYGTMVQWTWEKDSNCVIYWSQEISVN